MAAAKKKASTAAKRTVKYAAKTQSNAARTASKATQSGANWAKAGAADWQKGASEWAKQSAKLYQLPFAQGDVDAATKQAAAAAQSAGENMMKMSSDMMQQIFGGAAKAAKGGFSAEAFNPAAMFQNAPNMFQNMPQMKGFDAASAQEKMAKFAREAAEQIAKSTGSSNRALNEAMELSRENAETVAEVSNMAINVSKQLGAELIGYMNKLFAQNVELSKQVLSCRTLNDMFDLSSRIMKTNLDGFFSESVKMSEMLFQCATDVSEPLNDRISDTTERLRKAMSA